MSQDLEAGGNWFGDYHEGGVAVSVLLTAVRLANSYCSAKPLSLELFEL